MYFSPFAKQNQAEVWPRFLSLTLFLSTLGSIVRWQCLCPPYENSLFHILFVHSHNKSIAILHLHGWSYYLERGWKQWQLRANPLGVFINIFCAISQITCLYGKTLFIKWSFSNFLIDLQYSLEELFKYFDLFQNIILANSSFKRD